jgi:hypothetical protein
MTQSPVRTILCDSAQVHCLQNFSTIQLTHLPQSLHLSCPASMEQIKATFAQCKKEKRAALVTYVTAGYPTADETPDIMLGMQAGGAGTVQAFFFLAGWPDS